MGERGTIRINFEEGPVCFYTHWQGDSLPENLQKSLLRGKSRWDDPSYLARIIFSSMIQEGIESLMGYGISPTPHMGNHPILEIYPDKMNVSWMVPHSLEIEIWSFEEFTKLPETFFNVRFRDP